jgi:hypothetical protein
MILFLGIAIVMPNWRSIALAEVSLIGSQITIPNADSHSYDPAACYNAHSDQYLVLWRDSSEPLGYRMKGQRIDANTGNLLGSTIYISSDPGNVYASKGQAVYNPINGEWFVAYEATNNLAGGDEQDIFGQRIASDGTMIGPYITLRLKTGFQRDPHVAHDPVNNRYLVVWFHNTDAIKRQIFCRLFDSLGSPLGSELKLNEVDARENYDPRVAFNPVYNEYMVVWSDMRNYPGTGQDNKYKDIYGQRIDPDGNIIGVNIEVHVPPDPVNNPNGQDNLNSIVCNTQDGRYAIGFHKLPVGGGDYKSYAMVFDRTGGFNSGEIEISHPQWGTRVRPAYSPNTNTYYMTYKTSGCKGREVSAVGVVLTAAETIMPEAVRDHALTIRPSDGLFLSVRVNDSGGTYAAQRFTVGIDLIGPDPVANFTATAGTMSNVLNWDNPLTADYTGCMIRYRVDGQPPVDINDGQLVVDKLNPPGISDSFVHQVIDSRLTYHYTAFAHDGKPNYAAGVNSFASPWAAGDFEPDGDVDQEDFGCLQVCFGGDGVLPGPGCEDKDLDGDLDVDLDDFAIFQGCIGGPNNTPGC